MSTGLIIALLIVAVLVVAAAIAAAMRPRMRDSRIRRRFGPEYERTLTRHDGDHKAAEKELEDRLHRYDGLELRPLSAKAREEYVGDWAVVQKQFVDSPGRAVTEADLLVAHLARDRGYPDDRPGERFDALSVHHAPQVQGYRDAHEVAGRAREGHASTEELREAMTRARAMFEELVKPGPQDKTGHRQRSAQDGKEHTHRSLLHPRAGTHRHA